MQRADSPPAKARRTLPAAALLLLAGLVIAGVWSATDAMVAAREVRRSSVDLANLARLRVTLAEARMQRPRTDTDRRPARSRESGFLRRLARERLTDTPAAVPDSLLLLLRESATAPPEESARLERDLHRHLRLREEIASLQLEDATKRLETRALQTLFANLAVGLVALGAAAAALRRHAEGSR